MDEYMKRVRESAGYIRERLNSVPETGIVLGSGLGSLADDIEAAVSMDYKDIPGFPSATVKGHEGRLVCGTLSGRSVIAMKGRFHHYEGHDIHDVVFHIRVFKLLGISSLVVTNAAGGINKSLEPGDLMLIRDHISLFAPSPLRGGNIDEMGTRFPDMTQSYDRHLAALAIEAADGLGMSLKQGVYAFTQGPMYETPAEIRVLAMLGADAAGMSTVPEVIAARHAGMGVLGISCITNMAAGILGKPLGHEEVMRTAAGVQEKFKALVKGIISLL